MSKSEPLPETSTKPPRTAQDRPKAKGRPEQQGPLKLGSETTPDAKTRWASRIVGEADVRPTVLIPNPLNFRSHPKSQQRAMNGVLDELGWIQRVIVNKRTGHIIDGHLRAEMALENHEATVPVCYVDLSENEERLALATFDPISAMAIADEDIHAALLRSIECDNAALNDLLGVTEAEQSAARQTGSSDQSGSLSERFEILITAGSECEQAELLQRFTEEGLQCRSLIA